MKKKKPSKKKNSNINIKAPQYFKPFLYNLTQDILEITDKAEAEISIYITDDEYIKELNRRYRNKDKPTDVLSFPINEYIDGKWIAGDIVISLQTAKRQAKQHGHSLKEELKRLIVHGFVHLLGYDHEISKEEEHKFFEIESSILRKLNHL